MARTKLTSPKGTAAYPSLLKPDYKFKQEGEYKVTLRLSEGDGKAFVETLDKILDDHHDIQCKLAKKKLKKAAPPYKVDEETGDYLVKFSLKAKVTPKTGQPFTQAPIILDAKKKPVKANVGGGSLIKVGCEVNDWVSPTLGAGISLWVKVVQVISLSSYSADAGFELDEEEGFDGEGFEDASSSFDTGGATDEPEEQEDLPEDF